MNIIKDYKNLLFNLLLTFPFFMFTGKYAYKTCEYFIIYLYGYNPLYVEVIINFTDYMIFCILYVWLIMIVWIIFSGAVFRALKWYIPFVEKHLR